jgi:cell division protein FtsB
MKILAAVLTALIVIIQYPLWLGKGGWLRVSQIDQELRKEKDSNARLEQRNTTFAAEVRDLKQGTEAIEERARYELGMIRGDEVFFQYADENRGQSPVSPPAK